MLFFCITSSIEMPRVSKWPNEFPAIKVDWLACKLRIQKVLCSENPSPETRTAAEVFQIQRNRASRSMKGPSIIFGGDRRESGENSMLAPMRPNTLLCPFPPLRVVFLDSLKRHYLSGSVCLIPRNAGKNTRIFASSNVNLNGSTFLAEDISQDVKMSRNY